MKDKRRLLLGRIARSVCLPALFWCFMASGALAAEGAEAAHQTASVVSTRTAGDGIYVYIKGVDSIAGGTTVQLGNTLCEEIQVADVVSMGMPIRTTILLDNSSSLSRSWGDQAKELIKGLIDTHAENEEFKIATFADKLNVVADFSTEYESLRAAVEEIEFLNQQSYLTDILYDFLKEDGSSGEANYIRLIIITDGADDNEIKYTQTELSDLMKSSGVVIHAVGVSDSKNKGLLEALFSYARLTGGTYNMVEENTDVEGIMNRIQEDHALLCLKLTPKAEVLDGSRKEAKFSLSTPKGQVVLTASLQMPFADVSSMPADDAEPSEAPAPETEASTLDLPSIVIGQQAQEKASEAPEAKKNGILLVAAAGAVLLMLAAALMALIVLKGRKKRREEEAALDLKRSGAAPGEGERQDVGLQAFSAPQGSSMRLGGNTVKLGGGTDTEGLETTLRLQAGTGRNVVRKCFVTLTDIDNPHQSFRVPIDARIVIGRGAGDIVLRHDAAVSHTHCEIVKKGNLFYINDLKSSNGTFYENMRVCRETPIMSGGILEVGTGKYKLTIENG